MTKVRLGSFGVLFLWFVTSTVQGGPMTIKLTLKHNGKLRAAPHDVRLSFNNHSVRVRVRDDRFEVPAEFIRAKDFAFSIFVDGEEVRITNLSVKELRYENWAILLADRKYDEDYRSIVSKGADVRSSCILVLESANIDPGATLFQAGCRIKQK